MTEAERKRRQAILDEDEKNSKTGINNAEERKRRQAILDADEKNSQKTTSPSVKSSGSGASSAVNKNAQNTQTTMGRRSGITSESNTGNVRTSQPVNMKADAENRAKQDALANMSDAERQQAFLSDVNAANKISTPAKATLERAQKKSDDNWEKEKVSYQQSQSTPQRTSADVEKEIDEIYNEVNTKPKENPSARNINRYEQLANPQKSPADRISELEAEKEDLARKEQLAAMSDSELKAERTRIEKERAEHKEKYGGRAKQLASYTAAVAKDDFSGQPEKRLGDYNNELGYVQNEEIKRDDYYNKFHSMSNEERTLVAQINAFDEGYDRDGGKRLSAAAELKNKYNYTNDDIVAMTYFYNRYANKHRARDDEINARVAAEKSPFWSSAVSVPMNIAGGIGSAFGIADSYIDNKKAQKLGIADMGIDYNHPANRMQREAQAYRSEFTDNHDLMIGGYDVGDMLYNTAMSGIESAVASVLPGWGGALVLGINAATSTTNELAQRGLSSEKAIVGGIAAGAFETIFEKVSIGNLKALKEVDAKTVGDVVKNIAKSMGVNATEEAATEAANIIYDTLAHGDLSNYQIEVKKLIESGVDEKTAQMTVAKGLALQVVESAASGALMGFGFGGASTVPGYIANNAAAKSAGREINQSGRKAGVLEAAKAMPTDTRAYKLSQKAKADENGNISDKQIGKIAQAEADYISEQKKPDSGYFKGAQSAAELGDTYKRVKNGIENQTSITENARKKKLAELERQYTEAKKAFRGVGTANAVKRTVQKDSSYFAHREQRQIDELKRVEVKHPELIIGDKSVNVAEIVDIEDGDIKVKTTGGEEISLSQSKARFADADVKRLYDEAAKMNKDTAKVFLESYDGDDVAEYKRAFEYYYNMGKAGTSVQTIREHDGVFGAILTADAQQRIAEAGLMDKEFKSGVTDWSVKNKSNLYKFEKGVLQAIGEKFGTEFIILDESSDLNAKYLTGTNRIVVYRNADGGVMLRSAAHETYHFVESYSAKDAADLRDYVLDALKENGVDIEKALEKYAEQGPYDTREKQISELVADSMFDVFSNVDFINKLATEKPKLTRRITDKIGEWVKAIRSAVKMLSVRGENPEIKALMNDAEKLDTIRNMLLEGYKNAGENFKAQKDDIRTEKPKSVNSFASAGAKYTVVYQAESMEREGATRDEIWKKLGIIRDAKGMWVYEIDDSEMKIYPNGDARLRNEEGYRRMTELFNKFIFGEKLTDAEQEEYSELQKKYDIQKKIAIDIGDFIVHDKLFEEYPEIEKATFGFDDLQSKGKRGYYDKNLNEIVVDNSLKKEINKGQLGKTAIHEIQHAIQHFDGRAGGASIEYWEKKNFENLREMQNNLTDKKIERAEFFAKLDNELKARIREVNNADDYDVKEGYTEKDRLQLQLLDNDTSGNYLKLLDMDSAIRKLEAEIEYLKKTDNSKVQYYDTAGEIEARETADRLKMNAEERAEKMPDLGWERAVFAEGSVTGYDIINLDNGMSYIKSSRKVIKGNNKAQWRKQITNFFNKSLKNNYQIKITTINGDVLYITKDTANKARSDSVIENGIARPLSDAEFFVKLEASAHIDELAEISALNNNGKKFPDTKNHSFAVDGFTYRTVYFEDSNNEYYKITLSIGHNGNIATIYNVGQIKKDSMPNGKIISMIGSKADILSNDIIPETRKSVKQNLSESDAEYLEVQKQNQLDIINETNPAPNTYSTWIRSVDDIKTLAETLEDDDWDYEEFNPDLTREDIQNAIESGKIIVYSSYPIKNGVFVSPSRMEAESYSGNGKIYEKTVDINDVAWIDPTQGQYAKPDAVYSMKQTDPIQAHYAEVMRENRNLKNIISALDEMQYSSARNNIHLDGRDIHNIAGRLLRNASSKYELKTFEDELTAVYDYMANGRDVDTEAVFQSILGIANRVLEKSEMKDTELYEQYKDVRDFLKSQPIYITPNVKAEIISQFGDYKSFRNLLMGKVNRISTTNTEARTLDEVWKELHEKAPEDFPEDVNELDMPMHLTMFFESVAPKIVNPYEHYQADIEEAAALLATDIYEKYFEVGRLKSEKEKYRDLMNENLRKLAASKQAMRNEFRRKTAENEQMSFERYKTRVAEYRQRREEGDRRRVLRNQLERNYNYLNRRLMRETDNDHIPENLKPLISAFRSIVPDSNSNFSKSKFAEFENEYRKLENSSAFFDEDMADKIGELAKRVTSGHDAPKMRELNNAELQSLRDISEHMKYVVQNENKLFSDRLKGRIDSFAQTAHSEMKNRPEARAQGVPDFQYKGKWKDKAENFVDSFMKGLTKPEYLFESLGSETLKTLYDEMRRGENTEARILFDAKTAEQDIKRRNGYDKRWESDEVTLKLRSGDLTVTTEQAMALYATSKRNQGLEHMLKGGVIIYTKKQIKKNGAEWEKIRKEVIKDAKKNKAELTIKEINEIVAEEYAKRGVAQSKRERRVFTEQDIQTIKNSLTANQISYVNEMVDYITNDIGNKRNEISMRLYGIEKYKEKFYFPIKVDKHFLDSSLGKQEVISTTKNQSSSKRTVNKAANPIEITGFTETVNNHIYDSALYCAYVLPIEDFKRVYNFRDKVIEGEGAESLIMKDISIKEDIRRTKGINAIKEIEQFMVALDSGSRYENLMPFSAKLAARAKKTAVMANLSVVVQQPTAVFRAMLYISPKHFTTWASKADIAEMKKWNGCALKKEIGYFDVNMGRTATDFINEYKTDKSIKKDWSLKDRISNGNVMMTIDQAAGWGATKADEMTWGAIWKACKKQTKEMNPELTGDALNREASELFQTTISKTQVYDSVFTKPEYMRRKEGFAMMATQFMSEPLTSLNMLAEAVVKAKEAKGSAQQKDARKFCTRAFACYVTSVVVNSALKSLIYTMRDDDEDKSFLEKYIANVTEGIVTDPIGMFPYVKDIFSIVQGYDLNRTDVAVFAYFKDAVDALGSDKKTGFEKVMSVMKAAGQASGIPAYAVLRDAKAIIDIGNKIINGVQNGFEPTTGRGIINELKETFDFIPGVNPDSKYDQLYNAIAEGDKKHYDKVYNNLVAGGKDESTIDGELAKRLAENDGRIAAAYEATANGNTVEASKNISQMKETGYSEDVINKALSRYKNNLTTAAKEDERSFKAAEARYNKDYDEYERIIGEMVRDGYSELIVKDAINSQKIELETKADEFTVDEKDRYTASYDLKNALLNGNSSDDRKVHSKLVASEGKEKADEEVRKYAKSAYKSGAISETEAKRYLTEYKNADDDENDIFWIMEDLKGGDDYQKYGKLYDAIDNGRGLESTISYYTEHGVDISNVRKNITEEYKPKLTSLTPGTAEYREMYDNVIDAIVATGKTEAEARKQVNKWFE